MKTIIAGSRDIEDYGMLLDAIERAPWTITEVVSGGAKGPDRMGERWAKEHPTIPVTVFKPDWYTLGKAAGMIRNSQMAQNADALIALWNGYSRGTRNMIEEAIKHNLRVLVATIKTDGTGKGWIVYSERNNNEPLTPVLENQN